ncbi:MAG: DEAD/DEAH box helicase [Bacteroidales bacterium]
MSFNSLDLIDPVINALTDQGYVNPTPIQQQAIPHVLSQRDLQGCAQTGTGKTAAFAIPIIQLLHQQKKPQSGIRALVITPTRELAIQIEESFATYGKYTRLRQAIVFGGVSQVPQVNKLKRGVDILVATPGRLLDLINQGYVHLNQLEIFVLDEADRMLDMGFIRDIQKVIRYLPARRQTLFFSATMPKEIQKLASELLHNPVRVEVTPPATTVEKITQSLYYANKADKPGMLLHLIDKLEIPSALIFTRTKHGADRVVKFLHRAQIHAAAIHGNKSQNARQKALGDFKAGKIKVLVATDIAARGIDIDELSHVFNYDLPNIPETYVHRIGRTARARLQGAAIAFCDVEERKELRDIEKLIAMKIPVVTDHPFAETSGAVRRPANDNRLLKRTGRYERVAR